MAVNTTFTSGAILTAAQMNALPFGLVAEPTSRTSDILGFTTTPADVTGCSITFTAIAGRKYRANFISIFNSATLNVRASFTFTDGSNAQQASFIWLAGIANVDTSATGSYTFTATGTTTRKLRLQSSSNTVNVIAGSVYPTQFWIEDIGTA